MHNEIAREYTLAFGANGVPLNIIDSSSNWI